MVSSDGEDRVIQPASRAGALENDPLREFHVWWDDIAQADSDAFRHAVDTADDERPIQDHLATTPILLVQHLGGGHGRWSMPQKRLGSEFIPDFVIGERSSAGFDWTLVELQSPNTELFTKKGRTSEQLDEGVRQILEWRRWLRVNTDYARRPRHDHGLGLIGIDDTAEGLVLIGREDHLSESDRQRRKQIGYDHRIQIHTYDWVTREAERRLIELHED